MRYSLVFGLFLSLAAQAADPTVVGHMRAVKVIDVTSMKLAQSSIDERHVYKSKAVIEIEGVYEGNGSYASLVGQLVPLENYAGSEAWPRYELKLFSVDVAKPVPLEGGGLSAVSMPRPFKVQLEVNWINWLSGQNLYYAGPQRAKLWTVVVKSQRYQPVPHDKGFGFTLDIVWTADMKRWQFKPFGLEEKKS